MKAPAWLVVPALAALADVGVIAAGVAVARSAAAVALFLLLHLVAAALQGFLLSRALAGQKQDVGFRMALLGATIALFVPFIGSVALALALDRLLSAKPKVEGVRFQRYRPPDALTRRPPETLVARVKNERLLFLVRQGRSIDTRFRAVLQCNEAPAVVAVPVWKAALGDAAEEVRLSAFSQLEKMRRTIDARIETARAELGERLLAPPRAPAVHAALAQDYYELAYLGLVEGEVHRHALKEALAHAEASLALSADERDDGATRRLIARIKLRQAPSSDAAPGVREALDAARSAGIPLAELATDYAEEAYRRRAFDEVSRGLAAMENVAHDHVLLARVQEFWRWR